VLWAPAQRLLGKTCRITVTAFGRSGSACRPAAAETKTKMWKHAGALSRPSVGRGRLAAPPPQRKLEVHLKYRQKFGNMPEHCHGHRSVGVGMPPRRREKRPKTQLFEHAGALSRPSVGRGRLGRPAAARIHLKYCPKKLWEHAGALSRPPVGRGRQAAPPPRKRSTTFGKCFRNMPEHCHGPRSVGVGKPPRRRKEFY